MQSRRKILWLTLSACLASNLPTQAHPLQSDIPQEWIERLGYKAHTYARFLARYRTRFITPKMVIEPHLNIRGAVANQLPPVKLWGNIGRTLQVANHLTFLLRKRPKGVTSAYRSPDYNAQCPGAAWDSMHLQNNAMDVQFEANSSEVWEAANELRTKGIFKGGLGRYPTFTHIDTRGENISW